jgi:hypothetical protein
MMFQLLQTIQGPRSIFTSSVRMLSIENLFNEIIAENFSNIGKDIYIQI